MIDITKLHLCTPGCSYTTDKKEIVDKLLATGNFLFTKTYFTKKKWWQFWKRKKPVLYEVFCIK